MRKTDGPTNFFERILMKQMLIRISSCLGLTLLASAALSDSIVLVPTSDTTFLSDGDIVSFDVVADFSGDFASLGGGFDIVFDDSAVSFSGLNPSGVGNPAYGRAPDILPGVLESWSIGAFNGFDSSGIVIGNVQFEVLPGMGQFTVVSIRGTNGIGGRWISAGDNLSTLDPSYNDVEVSRGLPETILRDGFESN